MFINKETGPDRSGTEKGRGPPVYKKGGNLRGPSGVLVSRTGSKDLVSTQSPT